MRSSAMFLVLSAFGAGSIAHAGFVSGAYKEHVSVEVRKEVDKAVKDIEFYSKNPNIQGAGKIFGQSLTVLSKRLGAFEKEVRRNGNYALQFAYEQYGGEAKAFRRYLNRKIRVYNANKGKIVPELQKMGSKQGRELPYYYSIVNE